MRGFPSHGEMMKGFSSDVPGLKSCRCCVGRTLMSFVSGVRSYLLDPFGLSWVVYIENWKFDQLRLILTYSTSLFWFSIRSSVLASSLIQCIQDPVLPRDYGDPTYICIMTYKKMLPPTLQAGPTPARPTRCPPWWAKMERRWWFPFGQNERHFMMATPNPQNTPDRLRWGWSGLKK